MFITYFVIGASEVHPSMGTEIIYQNSVDMLFVENMGQLPSEVAFYTMHPSTIYIMEDGRILANGLELNLNSRPKVIQGKFPLITRISYFGQNRSISNIPTYKSVILREIYPHIDALLTADGRGVVEFQFIVHPGGNPKDISLRVKGGQLRLKKNGLFVLDGEEPLLKISHIRAFQGSRELEVEIQIREDAVAFRVEDYDRRDILVIDPILTAIVSSSDIDNAYGIAVDGSGVYITGRTYGYGNFAPERTTMGTTGNAGTSDVFVSKLDLTLSNHIATAILASSGWDVGYSIVVDENGVYVAGRTDSSYNFAPARTIFGTDGGADAFVSKLDLSLSSHLATAILASSSSDEAYAIAVDTTGVYVAGYTWNSYNFAPARNVFGTTGGYDAFVSKLDLTLTTHISTAILTSSSGDRIDAMALDGGFVYVAGRTGNYSDFAPSRTVFGTTGSDEAFVSKLDTSLSNHIATAILSSSDNDYAYALTVRGGSIYVAGETISPSDFAPDRTVFGTTGGWDAFVSKLDTSLTNHVATAILSSHLHDFARGIFIDESGVYVAGYTENYRDFAPDRVIYGTTGGYDAFVSKLDTSLSIHIATAILASSAYDYAFDITSDGNRLYVAGTTQNYSDFAPDRTVFGTTGSWEAFASALPLSLVGIGEEYKTKESMAYIQGRKLIVKIKASAYVGFEVYDSRGRLIGRLSAGYLPAGEYGFPLNLSEGKYTILIRMGNRVDRIKGVYFER